MTAAVPVVSLVLDLEGGTREQVERSISSLAQQTSADWELVLHGDGAETSAAQVDDPRVRSVSSSGSKRERAQTALRTVRGTFTGFIDAGDELAESSVLETVDRLIGAGSDLDLVYGDEVAVDADGTTEAVARPEWSPERLLGHAWLSRLTLLRSTLALEVCRDEELLEAWERDLLLRVSALARRVERVPAVLLRSRRTSAGDLSADDELAAVRGHLRRSGVAAQVATGAVDGTCRVTRSVPETTSVTLVVPSRGELGLAWGERRRFVVDAVRSFLRHAGHARVEVVVVHTAPIEQTVLDELLALGEEVRLLPYRKPFCPPDMANLGVLSSAADVVVVMSERTEVVSEAFLTELIGPLTDPGIGMTGPRVLATNGTLEDAGLAFHRHRVQRPFAGRLASDPGPAGLLTISHECSGLGRTCLALRRETFDRVGGLSPRLPAAFDADLSFKVRHLGLRRVWVPAATVYSLGSRHRLPVLQQVEKVTLRQRWMAPELDEYQPASGAWQAARDRARLQE